MKNKYLFIFLVFSVSLLCFSCTQEEGPDNDATPVVKYARPSDSEMADSLLTSAAMGSTIALIGENLSGVQQIIFNDQVAKLNPVYVTNTSIVVTIPGSMPGEVTNKITLNTKTGKSCQFDFSVIIPSPIVNSISCEWAADGAPITIYGNYFFANEKGVIEILFPGNITVESSTFTTTSVSCVVPAGALPGTIVVASMYGTGRSQFVFRSDEGLFLDFEDPTTGWNTWGRGAFSSEGGLSGQYFKIEGTTGSWAWPADAIQLYFANPVQAPLVTEGEVADYALKFEYYSHTWSDTPFVLWFTANPNTLDIDGTDPQWHWKPYLTAEGKAEFKTDGWVTITVPLTEFNTNKEETETRSIGSVNDLVNLCGMFFGAADGSYPINLWIDNMRLVKIK